MVMGVGRPWATVNWRLAAQVAICADFFRLLYVLRTEREPDDLDVYAERAATTWTAYFKDSLR